MNECDIIGSLLDTSILHADRQVQQLQGGTLGDVRLVTGTAETLRGGRLPYRFVWKTQKRWERPGDPHSWRREYDLYTSPMNSLFSDALRWPRCLHAEKTDDTIQLWMEYIDGASGGDLTGDDLELAALALGRFQGRLYSGQPDTLLDISNLGDTGFLRREFAQWKPETVEYRHLRSDECTLPLHLRRMLIDTQENAGTIFMRIERLPVILCHRDFWVENIFISGGKVRLIDWDTAGWGYLGEDVASLIADDIDFDHFEAHCRRLIPAYYRGIAEHMDISRIDDFCIKEMILIKFGYRLLQAHMFAKCPEAKNEAATALGKIYAMEGGTKG